MQLALAAAFLAMLLACCWLSYRFIEAPMQRQGRRFTAWLECWVGPDVSPGHHQRPANARLADARPAHAGLADARPAHAGPADARPAESVSRLPSGGPRPAPSP